jgi:hypothetical protein
MIVGRLQAFDTSVTCVLPARLDRLPSGDSDRPAIRAQEPSH